MLVLSFFALSFVAFSQNSEEFKLDGTSTETLEVSLQEIKATLSKDEVDQFSMAIFTIVMSFKDSTSDDRQSEELLKILDGKTVMEVVKYVDEMEMATIKIN